LEGLYPKKKILYLTFLLFFTIFTKIVIFDPKSQFPPFIPW